jgi:hypothetical protein
MQNVKLTNADKRSDKQMCTEGVLESKYVVYHIAYTQTQSVVMVTTAQ